MTKIEPKVPKYLRASTKKWWKAVVSQWVLEDHHVRLLTLAAGAWDRAEQARELLAEHGLTFMDPKLNRPVARPEVAIERDSRLAFARLLRELDLDIEAPAAASKPPSLRSIRGGRNA
jgi:phage terminase small subunit